MSAGTVGWIFAFLFLALLVIWIVALLLVPIVAGLKLIESTRRKKK